MLSHCTHLPPVRLKSFKREAVWVVTTYLLMVFAVQCVWALPSGLHPARHSHTTTTTSFSAALAPLSAQRHAHNGEFHSHASDTTDIVPLGEAGDDASVTPGLALAAGIWPAALLFALILGREAFYRAAPVRFSSRGTRVPLRPPQRG